MKNRVSKTAASALPLIRRAVGTEYPLIADGGVRSGSDVVKLLCLGASAVMIGRIALWGLATGGSDGVRTTLQILKEELEVALKILGANKINELSSNYIHIDRY